MKRQLSTRLSPKKKTRSYVLNVQEVCDFALQILEKDVFLFKVGVASEL